MYQAIMIFQFSQVRMRSEPDGFSLAGIQLKPTRCTPDCYVCNTVRQTRPYGINVICSAAGIQLGVIGIQVRLYFVSGQ